MFSSAIFVGAEDKKAAEVCELYIYIKSFIY